VKLRREIQLFTATLGFPLLFPAPSCLWTDEAPPGVEEPSFVLAQQRAAVAFVLQGCRSVCFIQPTPPLLFSSWSLKEVHWLDWATFSAISSPRFGIPR
jgi:hypothetical protein